MQSFERQDMTFEHTTVLVLIVWIAAPAEAVRAQEPSLAGNDFSIDAVTTPVLASSRITGLAGAYTALAEGIDGAPWNPASYASRSLYEIAPFEYDLTASLLFGGGAFGRNDYFLNGSGDGFGVKDFLFMDAGFRLQFGSFGFGSQLQLQAYALPAHDNARGAQVHLLSVHGGAGYGFYDGQLVIGVGARAVSLRTSVDHGKEEAFALEGGGAEAGVLYRPERLPLRIGAAFRMPVRSVVGGPEERSKSERSQPSQVAGLWRPNTIELPWEVQAGVALQLGPRPLNRRYRTVSEFEPRSGCALHTTPTITLDTLRDELNAIPRRYLLISFDLVLLGPIDNAIGVDAFFQQRRRTRGKSWSTVTRLGLESELLPHRFKLRIGSYIEQSRYAGVPLRVHSTAGFDLRLFALFGEQWRTSFVIDAARDYLSWGMSIGLWH